VQEPAGGGASPGEGRRDRIAGALLGTAVGDAIGLPREGLSPRRAARLFGPPPLRHRFLLGRGMVSDDTEHTCLTAQALLAAPHDADAFARSLGWRLRGWLLGLPAGIGLGTLRALIKLWLGFPPRLSGVFSAGNGPAMRAPILGACLSGRPELLGPVVRASTRITHTDPRAEEGALLVALAAAHGARGPVDPDAYLHQARAAAEGPELLELLARVAGAARDGAEPAAVADELGWARKGVSGYVNQTVPAALFCWLRYPDSYRQSVEAIVGLGGDSDTTAAILGGIAGASLGADGIPSEWVDGLCEWPRSVAWMRALAERLALRFPATGDGEPAAPLGVAWPAIPLRNLLFTSVVLLHGFRRLLPPY
jgi:ADP-ribosylglycohydrolase